MRDQYAGDVSDVLKFAFLRALAGGRSDAWRRVVLRAG